MADVIEVDHGYRNVMEALAKLEDLTVEVGIYGKEAKAINRGSPVAKYAGVHEADTAWMRDTWDEQERAHDQMIEALRDRVLRGEDPIELMRQMGEYHKGKFQEKIKRLGLWRKGMMQAHRYKFFSHASILVLPKQKLSPAVSHLDVFRKLRVGLWGFDDNTGSITSIYTPRPKQQQILKYGNQAIQIANQVIR